MLNDEDDYEIRLSIIKLYELNVHLQILCFRHVARVWSDDDHPCNIFLIKDHHSYNRTALLDNIFNKFTIYDIFWCMGLICPCDLIGWYIFFSISFSLPEGAYVHPGVRTAHIRFEYEEYPKMQLSHWIQKYSSYHGGTNSTPIVCKWHRNPSTDQPGEG